MSGENGKRPDDDLAGIDALIEAAAESEGAQPRPGAAHVEPEDERAPDPSKEVEDTEARNDTGAARHPSHWRYQLGRADPSVLVYRNIKKPPSPSLLGGPEVQQRCKHT